MKLSKSSWKMGRMLMLLIFSFVSVLGALNNTFASQIISYEDAQARKDYWGRIFPQYDLAAEGYQIILPREKEQERVAALVEYAEMIGFVAQLADAQGASINWNSYFEKFQLVVDEARRLGLDQSIILELLNRFKQQAEKIRLKVQLESGEPLMSVLLLETLKKGDWVIVFVLFFFLESFFPIFHVPVFRLCSSTCECYLTNTKN